MKWLASRKPAVVRKQGGKKNAQRQAAKKNLNISKDKTKKIKNKVVLKAARGKKNK